MVKEKIRYFLLFVFMFGVLVQFTEHGYAQAPAYSREAVAARDAHLATEGITQKDERLQSRMGSDMLMSGQRSIGNARNNVRRGGHSGGGQSAMLRFDEHRDVKPPSDATVHLGPWYTDIGIGQQIGVQYIKLDGAGVKFNTQNGRGQYLKDGFETPLISTLYLNNYVILTRHMDLSFNVNVSYAYYPFDTQENALHINMSDEGVFATFSSEFEITRDLKLLLYDDILYQTDYIDTRGMKDVYGGQQYEHFDNTFGGDLDWRLTREDNLSFSASRRDVISFDKAFDDQEGVFYSELVSYQRELTRFAAAGLYGTAEQSLYTLDTREDVNIYGLGTFTSAQITRKLYGNASLGYNFSVYPDSDNSTQDGSLALSLGLGDQISEEKYQSLNYDRSQTEAFRGGVDVTDTLRYQFRWDSRFLPGTFDTSYRLYTPTDNRGGYSDWNTSANVNYQLTRRWNLKFMTSYQIRWNDPSKVEITSGNPDINSDYATWVFRVDTSRPITKKINFNIYAEHSDRMSDNDNLAYTQDSVGAYLDWRHKF